MNARRRAPVLAAAFLAALGSARAAEIVLEQSAVQKLVAEGLFRDGGRFYAQRGACGVYLENPTVTLSAGRVVIRSHLSGRFGQDADGTCFGVGLASWTVVSGLPSAQGAVVRLGDIRVDNVEDPNTRLVLNSGLVPSLPGAIDLDVLGAVRTMLQGSGGQIQAEVQSIDISGVNVADNRLSIRFEFRLIGR
jgi:hypothetical protein